MDRLTAETANPPSDLVQVVLPVAVDRTFIYSVPPELGFSMRPGLLVEVPFRNRRLTAVVVATHGVPPAGRLRAISAVPDPDVALSSEMLEFTRWLADYYGASWGEVARAALPGYLGRRPRRRRSEVDLAGDAADTNVAGAFHPPASDTDRAAGPPNLTDEQRRAFEQVTAAIGASRFHVFVLQGITASGKTEVYMRAASEVLGRGGQALVLVPEIGISVQLLEAFGARFGEQVAVFHSDLPDTERRRTWKAVRDGTCKVLVGARSALFAPFAKLRLVVVDEEHEPAYKQTEQPRYHARDAAVMRARMNNAVVVLGSATPSLETAHNVELGRYERLRLTRRVDQRMLAKVELADLRRLRDERRAEIEAARRAQRQVWLRERAARIRGDAKTEPHDGRAVPAGERGPAVAVGQTDRPPPGAGGAAVAGGGVAAGAAPGARATAEVPAAAASEHGQRAPDFLSPVLVEALDEVLDREQQAILLVGRRGHATFVQCTDCGQVCRCKRCDVSLVHHAVDASLRCHHCGRREGAPTRCDLCGSERFWYGGVGTQRVEAELKRRLKRARVLRMDLDSTRRAGAHRRLVRAFAEGSADILLGTQMVAKGLHFPRVTLVGVVSADTQLNLPDFRAGERTFQLLTQVAGRAGRGDVPGRVVIQTYIPDHPAIRAACAQDYDFFYDQEMVERRELGYPPIGAMARFLVDGPHEEDVVAVADRVAARASALARGVAEVAGPAPLPLARLRGRHRWHVTLLGAGRGRIQRLARSVFDGARAERLPRQVRLFLDMDPIHLM